MIEVLKKLILDPASWPALVGFVMIVFIFLKLIFGGRPPPGGGSGAGPSDPYFGGD